MASGGLTKTDLPLQLVAEGKVRSLYTIPNSNHLLFVATDRVSCFDVVLPTPIPQKGALLTALTAFWLSYLQLSFPSLHTHFVSLDLPSSLFTSTSDNPDSSTQARDEDIERTYAGRSMIVRNLAMLPIESVVRGYLAGSAWAAYKKSPDASSPTIFSHTLPPNLAENAKLPAPIWTPTTKAPPGQPDLPLSRAEAATLLTPEIAQQVEELSLAIYSHVSAHAESKGLMIADTKFEFGLDASTTPPTVVLADEVLTPDSSRFWRRDTLEKEGKVVSVDKQVLRDWLIKEGKKGRSDVELPAEVVKRTRDGYMEAFHMLVGKAFGE